MPPILRKLVVKDIHDINHPSARRTAINVKKRFVWPGMTTTFAIGFDPVLNANAQIGIFPDSERFSHIYCDIVGPLPQSQGYRYILTILDRATNRCEAVPVTDTLTETIVESLVIHWISRFGVPAIITIDRGPQFTSALFID